MLFFRECILKTAKALVEDTKLLVSGAGASQEKLAQAAQSSVSTITKLADVVKLGAASLGSEDPETQVVFTEHSKYFCDSLFSKVVSLVKSVVGSRWIFISFSFFSEEEHFILMILFEHHKYKSTQLQPRQVSIVCPPVR